MLVFFCIQFDNVHKYSYEKCTFNLFIVRTSRILNGTMSSGWVQLLVSVVAQANKHVYLGTTGCDVLLDCVTSRH